MPCIVESASLEPKYGNKFIAGGEDMWVHVFDFHTGQEVGKFPEYIYTYTYSWALQSCFSCFAIFFFLLPFLISSLYNFSHFSLAGEKGIGRLASSPFV